MAFMGKKLLNWCDLNGFWGRFWFKKEKKKASLYKLQDEVDNSEDNNVHLMAIKV